MAQGLSVEVATTSAIGRFATTREREYMALISLACTGLRPLARAKQMELSARFIPRCHNLN